MTISTGMMTRFTQLLSTARQSYDLLVGDASSRRGGRPTLSYSQCGEDVIVDFLLRGSLGIHAPYYLDIGAHHPIRLNNTYRFYRQGLHGVCVEPNPSLGAEIRRQRPRDQLVAAGVAAETGEASYYVMDADTLNTFSKVEAERYVAQGHVILEERRFSLRAINDVLENVCERCPDLISLDIEAGELELLHAWDFERYRPQVMCIETLTYSKHRRGKKVREVIDLVRDKDYWVYADTFINTIFVDQRAWQRDDATISWDQPTDVEQQRE